MVTAWALMAPGWWLPCLCHLQLFSVCLGTPVHPPALLQLCGFPQALGQG